MFISTIFRFLFLYLIFFNGSEERFTCKNESNGNVDWFVAIKPPGKASFFYITSQSQSKKWQPSEKDIQNPENLIANTLAQAYSSRENESFYLFYNDAPPNGKTLNHGHLKGIINFDNESGYWIIHSVPKFPLPNEYGYKKPQLRYGQSFICVSVNIDKLKEIVDQLLVMYPTVYSSYLPDNFSQNRTLMKRIQDLISNKNYSSITEKVFDFKTKNNFSFIHFAKSSSFRKDLYSGLIAPYLKTSMFVETWIRRESHSDCSSEFKIFNVKVISLNGILFKYTMDHSKWAVSDKPDAPFVCVGDINRMKSQYKRGGGSLCISNIIIWNIFKDMVKDFDHCQNLYFEGIL